MTTVTSTTTGLRRGVGWRTPRRRSSAGHSHDPADQVDGTLEASDAGRRAVLISLGVLAGTAALQAVVVVLSSSVALFGDTLHNLADALTAVPLLIAFRLARRTPTRRYTYGYGRAEDLAGVFVIAMIALSSLAAGWVAIARLIHPHGVDHLWAVAAAAVVGFVGNEVVARYRITVGRRIGSAALVADGLHARTDGFTSLAVLIGAGGVAVGWQRADPLIGLVITVAILGVLRSAARQVFARLMDAVDPSLVDQIEHVLDHTSRGSTGRGDQGPLDRTLAARRGRDRRRPDCHPRAGAHDRPRGRARPTPCRTPTDQRHRPRRTRRTRPCRPPTSRAPPH